MAARPGRDWGEFLETYDDRRREFEKRHPDLRTFRLVALTVFVLAALGTIVPFVGLFPVSYSGRDERPPTEGNPAIFTASFVVLSAVLSGLVVYGLIRWNEDRMIGQIALAIGLGGPAAVVVVVADCTRHFTMCLWIPGVAIVGILWLAAWLLAGLAVDHHRWSRGETVG